MFESYRLLAAQKGFYYGHQKRDNKADFNVAEYVIIEGDLDIGRFCKANKSALADVEVLSFVFCDHEGHGRQQIWPRPVVLELVDLRGLSTGSDIALSQMEVDSAKPFDVSKDVLYRQCLYRVSDSCVLWYFCSHHLLLDAFAMLQVISRVAKAYRNEWTAMPDQPALGFSTVVTAEDNYLESATYLFDRDFWQRQMLLLPEATSLSPNPQNAGGRLRFTCKEAVAPGWFDVKAERADWPTRLITGLLLYLWMMSGNRRQVIGIPMLARSAPTDWAVPACRVNVLPLSVDLCDEASVEETLAAVSARVEELKLHQQYPAGLLSSGLHSLPYNTVLNILPFTPHVTFDMQAESEVRNIRAGAVNDIAFTVRPDPAGLKLNITIDANTSLYTPSDLQAHASGLLSVVRVMTSRPQSPLCALPRPRPMAWLEGGRSETRPDLLSSIYEQARGHGPKIALTDTCNPHKQWQRITYQTLVEEVERLAHSLRACADFDVLVLDLARSSDSILFMLTALRLGIPFLVLNPARAQQMMETLAQHAKQPLLVERSHASVGCAGWKGSTQQLQIAGCPTLRFTSLQTDGTGKFGGLAYLMFTSGTTGKAKAVKISRRALNAFIGAAVKLYGFKVTDVVLNFSEHFFDACIEEIFGALAVGAELVIRPAEVQRSLQRFLGFCTKQAITVLDLPTAYWHEMALAMDAHAMTGNRVRLVIIGGERVSEQALRRWFEKVGDTPKLFNSYGPTEATVVTTCKPLDKATKAPIGRPLPGVQCAIVGSELTLLPQGAAGELLLFGDTLADGYLGDAELTSQKFVDVRIDGQMRRGYRTGDLAVLDIDNQLHYLGRLDHEVKVAGQRLNLADLEALFEACPGVREVCVVLDDVELPKTLCAHVHGDSALEHIIRQDLLTKVAPEFIPRSFYWHASPLPRTFAGKIDRTQLKRYDKSPPSFPVAALAERQGWLEHYVRKVWGESLGGNEELDFFEQGGDSLTALRMVNRMNAELGLAFTMEMVFDSKTLNRLVACVADKTITIGLRADCLELRSVLLASPLPVQAASFTTVYLDENPLQSAEDLQALAHESDLYLVIGRNQDHDEQPVREGSFLHDRLYWQDIEENVWYEGQAWPLARVPAVQFAIFIMPHNPEAFLAWAHRSLKRLGHLKMRSLERVMIVADATGRRWFEKHILSVAECERLEFHACSPLALQDRQVQEELIVVWSVRTGFFPDINLPLCFASVPKLIAALAAHPEASDMSARDRLFVRTQSFNPDVKVCGFAQWLNEITRYSGSKTRRNAEYRTVYRLNK